MMKDQDVCQISCVHQEKVDRITSRLNTVNTPATAKIFKALSDETRIKIAYALSIEDELCVCDAAAIVNGSSATASHHLRLLKKLGLAKYRKEGKLVYYSLVDEDTKQLILLAIQHQKEWSDSE